MSKIEMRLISDPCIPQTFKALTTCLDHHQHSNISKPLLKNHQTIKYNDKKIWIHAAKMFLKKTWRNIENNLFANKSFSNKTLPYNKILFSFISSVDSLIHLTVFFCCCCCFLLSHMREEIKDEKFLIFKIRKNLWKIIIHGRKNLAHEIVKICIP